jgi:hypothetical protein
VRQTAFSAAAAIAVVDPECRARHLGCRRRIAMDGKQAASGGGAFIMCLLLGIIFDNIALGIIFGLLLGGGAAKAVEKK